jgi:hypothetical protein
VVLAIELYAIIAHELFDGTDAFDADRMKKKGRAQ